MRATRSIRYFDNIRPGAQSAAAGSIPTAMRYVDRYAEQLWDTMFAKAPEITLFNWSAWLIDHAVEPGDRKAWKNGHDQLQLERAWPSPMFDRREGRPRAGLGACRRLFASARR